MRKCFGLIGHDIMYAFFFPNECTQRIEYLPMLLVQKYFLVIRIPRSLILTYIAGRPIYYRIGRIRRFWSYLDFLWPFDPVSGCQCDGAPQVLQEFLQRPRPRSQGQAVGHGSGCQCHGAPQVLQEFLQRPRPRSQGRAVGHGSESVCYGAPAPPYFSFLSSEELC